MAALNKICPYCGVDLTLEPPDKERLPNSVGVSANGVNFCVVNCRRVFSYMRRPNGRMSSAAAVLDEYGRVKLDRYNVQIGKADKWHIPVRPIPFIQKKIDQGGHSLYEPNICFLCANCGQKTAIDKNPYRFSGIIKSCLVILSFVVIMLIIGSVIQLLSTLVFITVSVVGAVFAGAYRAFSRLYLRFIEAHRNNFVPVNEYDDLILFKTDLVLSRISHSPFLCEGNILKTELCGESFYIYVVDKKQNIRSHICGMNGEPERLLALIREKREHGEKVILQLTFEGKFAGNTEVLDA